MRGYCPNPPVMRQHIRSDDSSIRQVGAGGQKLTQSGNTWLANDSSNDVVTSLASKLAEMKHRWSIVADDATREYKTTYIYTKNSRMTMI